jgi:DNA segregation ATPase FtsK/SpoIIIE, S-DNA-T family
VLLVDDHDLVAGATSNPLAGLADLLAMGRDIGFHLVLARRVGGFARGSFEPVVQRLRELGTPGLIMSGDPQEGPLLGGVKAVPLPPGRGHLVHRRGTVQVQVALTGAPAAAAWPATADRGQALQHPHDRSGGW